MAAVSWGWLEPSLQSRFPLIGFIAELEPVEAERKRDLSEGLGGGDDGRVGRALLAELDRVRKRDFRPKVTISWGSFDDWKEGELGTELERIRDETE